ncbi:hypothetical protein AURDEDRAFT_156029 [Auricularia subglabra TFB-10046 SS5]|nr:hypothetical protein AURDEDRAFT_156029 [Auricularia subglabra TFB-10046 SS5]
MYVGAALLAVVNALNIALIGLLFVTAHLRKIPRHPVVSTILWTAIPRSLVAALPAFQYRQLREDLPWKLDDRTEASQRTPLARFCAAQGMLMYYFLAAQAFFAVCFTVPMLMIAIQSSKLWKDRTSVRLPFPYLLSISPFVWALPTVCFAIPVLLQSARAGHPAIYFTPMGYCNIDSRPYQMLSACLIGIPLIVGVVLAVLIFVFMIRFYSTHSGVPRRGRVVDAGLMLRFSMVLIIVYLDAILTLCEISLDDKFLGGIWQFDLYWTTFTPMVEFILFGFQRPFLRTWRGWLLAAFSPCQPRRRQEILPSTCPEVPPPEKSFHRSSAEELDELDDEELEWSSDDDPYGRSKRRRRRRRQSSLFQWQRPPSSAKPDATENPPEIHIHPCDPAASPSGADAYDNCDVPTTSRTPAPHVPDEATPSPPRRPSLSDHYAGLGGPAAQTVSNHSLALAFPHLQRPLELVDSRLSTASSTYVYGRPMDYMYGEMHTFMGMVAIPRSRRGRRSPGAPFVRPPSAVEMHAAARIQPDDAFSENRARRGSTSSGRSRSSRRGPPGLYSYDQDARPKSLSAVDESLFELPSSSQEDRWIGTIPEGRPDASGDSSH